MHCCPCQLSLATYKLQAVHQRSLTPPPVAGSALSVAAGRLSYLYGFKGPSVAVDTACSSSLVGAHMARISMAQGGCTTTTAGKRRGRPAC